MQRTRRRLTRASTIYMNADPAPAQPGPGGIRPHDMSHTGTREIPVPPVRQHVESHPTGKRLLILSLTALGVVYGDIGTSPLYAIKECFKPYYGLAVTPDNVYGVLS